MRPGYRAMIIGWLTGAVLLVGCGDGSDTGAAEGIVVVVTTSVLGDVVANVVNGSATIEVLIPPGVDPHDFQPSSRQVAAMSTADLVVANGLGLEEGMADVMEAAEADGATVVEIAPGLDPIPFGHHVADEGQPAEACDPTIGHDDTGETEGVDDHDEAVGCDPHVWMDPLRMADAARVVAEALTALDPGVDWMARASRYGEELAAADAEIGDTLAGIAEGDRKLVTNHESFGYFADRYGFRVVGAVIPGGSTLADPSSADLASLVQLIDAEGVPAIFTEVGESDALARALAAEAGTEVAVVELYSDSLGALGSGADTLIGMLVTNAQRIGEALG